LFFGFCFSVFQTPRVVKAQPFWGFLGAGVPPFMGTLTPFAYWGALKVLSFQFSVFRFNPATQAFLPCGSAKSASSLCSRSAASVPFSLV